MRITAIEQGHTLAWKCHFPGSRPRGCSHSLSSSDCHLPGVAFIPAHFPCQVNYCTDNKEPNLGDLKQQKWTISQLRAPASGLVGRAGSAYHFAIFCQLIFPTTTGLNLEMTTAISTLIIAHCLPPACMSVQTSLLI